MFGAGVTCNVPPYASGSDGGGGIIFLSGYKFPIPAFGLFPSDRWNSRIVLFLLHGNLPYLFIRLDDICQSNMSIYPHT